MLSRLFKIQCYCIESYINIRYENTIFELKQEIIDLKNKNYINESENIVKELLYRY